MRHFCRIYGWNIIEDHVKSLGTAVAFHWQCGEFCQRHMFQIDALNSRTIE